MSAISFKPYYKWITFNTQNLLGRSIDMTKCFKPYYKWITFNTDDSAFGDMGSDDFGSFKPYYKWITFNT